MHIPSILSYQVYVDDGTTAPVGGVLLIINNNLLSQEQPDLKPDYNIIWSKMSIPGLNGVYVSAHENCIWILGELNMPNIDWSTESPSQS